MPRRSHHPLRRLSPLALTLALGCFVDEAQSEGSSANTGASSASEGSTEATGGPGSTGETSSSGSDSSTTSDATSDATSDTTSETDASTTQAETNDGSTTEAPAICGNGLIEPGEACDDGNTSDLDACLSTCAVASCRDGVRSQDETDVDCGGSCPPCAMCGACSETADCAVGECAKSGRCVVSFAMTIDYSLHCNEPDTPDKSASLDVPSGVYTATATPGSAGSVWSPPYNPPLKGWRWLAPCKGVNFAQMRSPDGVFYGTEAEAFAALMAPSENFTVTGDLLECGLVDSACSDNQGSVSFAARSYCE